MDVVEQKMLNNEQQKVENGPIQAFVSFDEAGGGNFYDLRHSREQKHTAGGVRSKIMENCKKTTENFQKDPKVHARLCNAFTK